MPTEGKNAKRRKFVLAIGRVTGATKACASRGDAAMFAQLRRYYVLVAEVIAPSGGRVVKVLGDGVLLIFPASNASAAKTSLRALQELATKRWRRFDRRCTVQFKVGTGPVMCGLLGAPGAERFDVVGDALNKLFKLPW